MARHHFKIFWTTDNAKATGKKVLGAFQKLKKKSPWLELFCCCRRWFPWWLSGKESACSAGDIGSVPRLGRAMEKEMASHSGILAWDIQ